MSKLTDSKLEKIDEFVEEHDVQKFHYHTWRQLENDGEVRVLVWEEDDPARTEYVCPDCGHHGYHEQEWKRPFWVECEECGNKFNVPKLKDKAKRERKKKMEERHEKTKEEMQED